jgi:hypothetical protein
MADKESIHRDFLLKNDPDRLTIGKCFYQSDLLLHPPVADSNIASICCNLHTLGQAMIE